MSATHALPSPAARPARLPGGLAAEPPHVSGDLRDPRSTELLAHQAHRESRARTHPRHLPIAIAR